MRKMLESFEEDYKNVKLKSEDIERSLANWMGYAQQANTYKLRKHLQEKHPFSKHISYIELLKYPGQWGHTYKVEKEAKEFEKSPADFALQMAYLSQIWKTLNLILEELRKERILK